LLESWEGCLRFPDIQSAFNYLLEQSVVRVTASLT
jgi:hypothetical protein